MSNQGENNKSNILSMDFLKEKHSQEFKMSEAWVDLNGEMLSYKYYEKFPETKKNEYIQEFMEFNFKLVNDEDYQGIKGGNAEYALILLIDKFTDIEVPEDDRQKLIYAGYLSDFDILTKIIDTLSESEVIDVMEKGTKIAEKQTARLKEMLENYENQTGDIETLSSLRLVEQDSVEEEQGE